MRFLPYVFVFLCFLQGNAQNLSNLSFGSDTTLELATWNIERFPKRGNTTIDSAVAVIKALEIDIWGLQEINDLSELRGMMRRLPNMAVVTGRDPQRGLAFVVDTSKVDVVRAFRIYENSSRPFPRRPLVLQIKYRGDTWLIVNNHFKCCGDGRLDAADDYDEETRRREASFLLKQWADSQNSNYRIVILGDLNDIYTDAKQHNVFQDFINDSSSYTLADMNVAVDQSVNWSYPSWPSHLDHIMVKNNCIDSATHVTVSCIRVDDELPRGWSDYDYQMSDHRPVAIKLDFYRETEKDSTTTSVNTIELNANDFQVFPNPSRSHVSIDHKGQGIPATLWVKDINGRVYFEVKNPEFPIDIPTDQWPAGVYWISDDQGDLRRPFIHQ